MHTKDRGTNHVIVMLQVYIYTKINFFGWESSQLACRVQLKRAQVEAEYWRNPEVARLEGTPAMDLGHINVVLK